MSGEGCEDEDSEFGRGEVRWEVSWIALPSGAGVGVTELRARDLELVELFMGCEPVSGVGNESAATLPDLLRGDGHGVLSLALLAGL